MPHHHDYDFDLEPSEVQPGSTNYTIFSRFSGTLPLWVWNSLMGVTPQNRRAFQLQAKYLTPLTFEYVLLTLFLRTVLFSFFCGLLWLLWKTVGYQNPVVFTFVLVAVGGIYIGYQWSVLKNTRTVREEVIFNTLTNIVAWCFACAISFNLSVLIKSTLNQIGV